MLVSWWISLVLLAMAVGALPALWQIKFESSIDALTR